MKSKWYKLKGEAISYRKRGYSIRMIEKLLRIPKSTLSNWFKDVKLTRSQTNKLEKKQKNALRLARLKAVLWHNQQKKKRIEFAQNDATITLKKINIENPHIIELALAFLYLGEGFKKNIETAIGSSDPSILKFFVAALKHIYHFDSTNIYFQLNLRADQSPTHLIRYWSKELKIPKKNFKYDSIDKRTLGIKTYPHYKGVCQLRCGNVYIQRKLVCLSKMFCKKIIDKYLS